MIHASRELVEAIRGAGPTVRGWDTSTEDLLAACGADRNGDVAFACEGGNVAQEDHRVVDCVLCLALMRAAICPVRWDSLCERGLVEFLLPKSEAA